MPTVFPVYRPYMETTPTQGHYLGHHYELKYSNDHETDDQADDVIDYPKKKRKTHPRKQIQ